jgi:hypothetical protein
MGQGIDICMGDPKQAATMEESVESEFVRTLVAQAGLVIARSKPAAIFGFTPRAWKTGDSHLKRLLSARVISLYAKIARPYGVNLSWVAPKGNAAMLLAWRPDMVERLLDNEQNLRLFNECGLPTNNARDLVSALVARLRSSYVGGADFPHEIGLVLGYPVEDVRGFMADGGRGAKVVGCWRCYGDVQKAQARFEELGITQARLKRLYSEGVSVRELLQMGVA